jgi:hypothetical protein
MMIVVDANGEGARHTAEVLGDVLVPREVRLCGSSPVYLTNLALLREPAAVGRVCFRKWRIAVRFPIARIPVALGTI